MDIQGTGLKTTMNYATGQEETIKSITKQDLIFNYPHASKTAGFAYRILNDKTNGTFVEIGSSHWRDGNHTYMLEKEFGWRGVGLEIQDHFVEEYNKNRESECILGDALSFNWDEYFEKNNFPTTIDFLQIDVDDIIPHSNLLALINVPFGRYKFNVISVEHLGHFDKRYEIDRDTQRHILYSYGYLLVASLFTEDWWIHSSLDIAPSTYDLISSDAWNRRLEN
jgi:hypothetical protein